MILNNSHLYDIDRKIHCKIIMDKPSGENYSIYSHRRYEELKEFIPDDNLAYYYE